MKTLIGLCCIWLCLASCDPGGTVSFLIDNRSSLPVYVATGDSNYLKIDTVSVQTVKTIYIDQGLGVNVNGYTRNDTIFSLVTKLLKDTATYKSGLKKAGNWTRESISKNEVKFTLQVHDSDF